MKCIHGIWLELHCSECALSAQRRSELDRGFPHRSLHDEAVELIEQFERTQPLPIIDESWRLYHVLPDDLVDVPP